MKYDKIRVSGARSHNLKNVSLEIPKEKLVVVTGLSGSGKSSLVFDTIYAEGQRRYVESLSSYARQFVGMMDKPDFDFIEGLSPAVSIDQRGVGNNPRSTVGTITEIYDYLRLMYAKVGQPYCPQCQVKLKREVIKDKDKPAPIISFACPRCSFRHAPFEPRDFSFNSSYGACEGCGGLGTKMEIDPQLTLNFNLSLNQGAIKALSQNGNSKAAMAKLEPLARLCDLSFDMPMKEASDRQVEALFSGKDGMEGLSKILMDKYEETKSSFVRQEIEKCLRPCICPDCNGRRLGHASLAVRVKEKGIADLSEMSIDKLSRLLFSWQETFFGSSSDGRVAGPIIKEVLGGLSQLQTVGLPYLSLSRSAASLSGGEAQRIRLATQVCSSLSGVLYVLDEPSIGLHQRDNGRLIDTLKNLRDNGNSVIVVEHDQAMMEAADYLVDVGPGAGIYGGNIIYSGAPEGIREAKNSLTADYLLGRRHILPAKAKHKGSGQSIRIVGASENNLKNIDVDFPLGKLVAVTGVSGSGKSTLVYDIFAKALNRRFYRAKQEPGKHKEIQGLDSIDKVIDIDQSPIGRTPRSNPATYTGLFTYIRDLFASLPLSRAKGLSAGHFSFNVAGGRCEHCSGDGVIKVEMQFLSDIYLTCDQCGGRRFTDNVLSVSYRGKNIYEVLNMTVKEALDFFSDQNIIKQKLETLDKVGLGYITLGQSATTFSGGEAQRIKLATELSRRATGRTLYILDEPTTGLHFADIDKLLRVLNLLVDQGNTVIVIEHNLDVIRAADWVIDLGPEGGDGGGQVVACGTPEEIIKNRQSVTGRYLKEKK